MRKTNKKIAALLFLLATPLHSLAADNDTTTSSASSSTTTPSTAKESTQNNNQEESDEIKRGFPSPQENRIKGLITQLLKNNANEIQTLRFNDEEFLALFRDASTGDTQGCILLLHGDNEHPDWPSVIHPIRTKLNENSWCTLSIEIPDVYPKESLTFIPSSENDAATDTEESQDTDNNDGDTALPNEEVIFGRMDAALAFLSDREFEKVAILGHRTGASYALKYSAQKELKDGALILIAPISPSNIDSFNMSQAIENIEQPILDYYFDMSPKEIRFARERQGAANRREDKNLVYQQIKALRDQRYQAAGKKRLTQRVWGFLKQNTIQQGQRRPLPTLEKGLFHKAKP